MSQVVSDLLATEQDKPYWLESQPIEEYHASQDWVGSSHLRKMLKSPRSFYSSFFERRAKEPSKAMQFGTLAHLAILEGERFRERYVVMPDFGDMRSSKNRDKRDGWKAEQDTKSIVCTQDEHDHLLGMVEAVVEHKDAYNLLKDGQTEVSGYYVDPETQIRCRIRPDFISFNMGSLVDIKTAVDCDIERFSRSVWDMAYHFQIAQYCEGAQIISGRKIEYGSFIVIEKEPPYEVAVYVADEAMMEVGRKQYHKSLRTLRKCLKTGVWPKYQDSLQNIFLPHWIVERFEDE